MIDGPQEFIQLQVQGARIPILSALNQKHDQKGYNGCAGVNH